MSKWEKFWAGLNIRKALALLFGLAMIASSVGVVFTALSRDVIDKDMISYGLTGITSLTTTLVGYYFGYSNGKSSNIKVDSNDQM